MSIGQEFKEEVNRGYHIPYLEMAFYREYHELQLRISLPGKGAFAVNYFDYARGVRRNMGPVFPYLNLTKSDILRYLVSLLKIRKRHIRGGMK